VYIPRGLAQQGQLASEIADLERLLGPDVLRLRYKVGANWSDEPAIFFRIVLSDEASKQRLREVASRVEAIIQEHLDPLNSWGLIPYYNFRSQTEQEILREPAWA
jgi:hypothetical protein